jgi:hypothetical protein
MEIALTGTPITAQEAEKAGRCLAHCSWAWKLLIWKCTRFYILHLSGDHRVVLKIQSLNFLHCTPWSFYNLKNYMHYLPSSVGS